MSSANPNSAQQPLAEKAAHPSAPSDTSSETRAEALPVENAPVKDNSGKLSEKNGLDDHNDKIELTEDDCYEELGFCFPKWKKWTILTVIFLVQTSMNFNTSLYSNALGGISEKFNVSTQAARVGAAIFLVFYAFGCELWAPWSEGELRTTLASCEYR